MKIVVESIEDGKVRLEKTTEEGTSYEVVSKNLLPWGIKEGDIVVMKDGKYALDGAETQSVYAKMRARFRALIK